MKQRKRIVILGWYGSNNTGDEALVQVIIERLKEHGFDDLVALSTNPGKTGGRLGVRSVSRNPFNLSTLRSMYGAKALILGGGGLIQDGTSVYNLPIYAMHVALAKLLGLKVIGWGLGAEPLWTLLGRMLARFICHSADYFSVRDSASKRLLVRAGVAPHMVKVTADPAILLKPEEGDDNWPHDDRPKVIFCMRHLPANQPGIGLHYLLPVSLRHRLGIERRQEPGRVEGLVEGVAGAIKIAVHEFGARVILLPLWPGRDDEMLDEVEQEALAIGVAPDMMIRAELEHMPARFSGYVGKADLLVSMRLHALIFAAAQGVPMIAISYARKVRGFMQELDFERWVVEVERKMPQPEELKARLRELWAEREAEAGRLRESATLAKRIAYSDAQMIVELVKK
jgi:polysaccharide pyruvyl transferase CsaB